MGGKDPTWVTTPRGSARAQKGGKGKERGMRQRDRDVLHARGTATRKGGAEWVVQRRGSAGTIRYDTGQILVRWGCKYEIDASDADGD